MASFPNNKLPASTNAASDPSGSADSPAVQTNDSALTEIHRRVANALSSAGHNANPGSVQGALQPLASLHSAASIANNRLQMSSNAAVPISFLNHAASTSCSLPQQQINNARLLPLSLTAAQPGRHRTHQEPHLNPVQSNLDATRPSALPTSATSSNIIVGPSQVANPLVSPLMGHLLTNSGRITPATSQANFPSQWMQQALGIPATQGIYNAQGQAIGGPAPGGAGSLTQTLACLASGFSGVTNNTQPRVIAMVLPPVMPTTALSHSQASALLQNNEPAASLAASTDRAVNNATKSREQSAQPFSSIGLQRSSDSESPQRRRSSKDRRSGKPRKKHSGDADNSRPSKKRRKTGKPRRRRKRRREESSSSSSSGSSSSGSRDSGSSGSSNDGDDNTRERNRQTTKTVPLYVESDSGTLSPYQCLARQQIELFAAAEKDAGTCVQGRIRGIVPGQVGIRCRHCAMLPMKQRRTGSVYYPNRLDGIYQSAQKMASGHLSNHCHKVPEDIRGMLSYLKDRKSSAGGKKYWAKCVRKSGVYETKRVGLAFEESSLSSSSSSSSSISSVESHSTKDSSNSHQKE